MQRCFKTPMFVDLYGTAPCLLQRHYTTIYLDWTSHMSYMYDRLCVKEAIVIVTSRKYFHARGY